MSSHLGASKIRVRPDAACNAYLRHNVSLIIDAQSPMDTIKYMLSEDQMPTAWYNIQADLPTPMLPVLNPATGQPIAPADLARL